MWGDLARQQAQSAELVPYDPTVQDERPAPPKDLVEFTAACDACGEDATWRAGLTVIKDPNGHGTLTLSTSWTEHCGGVAA